MDMHGVDKPESKKYIGEYYDKNSHSLKNFYLKVLSVYLVITTALLCAGYYLIIIIIRRTETS